jgi:glycerol kinase
MLNVPVVAPAVAETTALGAAYAAGLAVGYWKDLDDLRRNWSVAHTWEPAMDEQKRAELQHGWNKAVTKSFGWMD